jgi:hypothetical protein
MTQGIQRVRTTARFHAVHVVALATSLGLACIPVAKSKPPPAPARDHQAERDAQKVERMEKARAKAMAAPGSASEASDFAFALNGLHRDGIAARRNLPPTLVDDATQCLDKARQARPEEAHELLSRKGELLISAGRNDDGLQALGESMDAQPNLRAFEILGKSYKQQNQTGDVEKLCKRMLPAMRSETTRYTVLDKCIQFSGASTVEGGLRWASGKDVEFYRQKRAELDESTRQHQQQQRSEQREQWKAQDAERERARKEKEGCKRQCESVHSLCKSGCGSTSNCLGRCQSDAWSCKSSCR